MAWIRLISDYDCHKAGEKVDFPAVLARRLCNQGKAVCGEALNAPGTSYLVYRMGKSPVTETKPGLPNPAFAAMRVLVDAQPVNESVEESIETVYPDNYKPGTVKEIKAYLDKKGIKYHSQARKADLLKLL